MILTYNRGNVVARPQNIFQTLQIIHNKCFLISIAWCLNFLTKIAVQVPVVQRADNSYLADKSLSTNAISVVRNGWIELSARIVIRKAIRPLCNNLLSSSG